MRNEEPLHDGILLKETGEGTANKIVYSTSSIQPEEESAPRQNGHAVAPASAKVPSAKDFEFTKEEMGLVETLSEDTLPNTQNFSDRQYMRRLLAAIEMAKSVPTLHSMRKDAKTDYFAYKNFIKRNPEMEALLKKKRLWRLYALDARQVFHCKPSRIEQWMQDAINERRRQFLLETLKIETTKATEEGKAGELKSALGEFPTLSAIERKLGLKKKSLTTYFKYHPVEEAAFEAARQAWAETAPAKEFLNGIQFGMLPDGLVAICARRFTQIMLDEIKKMGRIPSDSTIAAAISREYGVKCTEDWIRSHREWLEKHDAENIQLNSIRDAKISRINELPAGDFILSLDAIRLDSAIDAAKYSRFAQILAAEAHKQGLATGEELAQALGTNTGTLRNLRINHQQLWQGVDSALKEEAEKRSLFVSSNTRQLSAALRFVLSSTSNDWALKKALGTSLRRLENARVALNARPKIAQKRLERFFHSFNASRLIAFAAALSLFEILPLSKQSILDTSAQQFAALAAKATQKKHAVSPASCEDTRIISVLHPFISNEQKILETINCLHHAEIFLFSCTGGLDTQALGELRAHGFNVAQRQTRLYSLMRADSAITFLIIRKECDARPLERLPLPFKVPQDGAQCMLSLAPAQDNAEKLSLVRRSASHDYTLPSALARKQQNGKPPLKH